MSDAQPTAKAPPRVLVIASHPIQYQVPWFRALARRSDIDFSVLFVQIPDAKQQGHGFGVAFEWDIPLLDGYAWKLAPEVRGPGGFDGFFAARIHKPLALLRECNADVVVLTGWHIWPLVQMLAAARWLRIPVIMRGESNALRPRGVMARIAHRILLAQCAAMLPIGRSSRQFYEDYGVGPEKLFDAPYFIDNDRFASNARLLAPERDALRKAWGIAPGATCFVYVGKLESKKRIFDLLAATAILAKEAASFHVLVVGSGELMAQAQAQVGQAHLPVTFAGFMNQSEITRAYAAADCLVLPSDFGETWGLVVNEAMACGLPAIVSDRVGCAQDLVTPGETGHIFAFGDITALAACMKQSVADPAALAAMGARARERVHTRYGIDQAVKGTVDAIAFVRDGA
ncbi:glycosyltransferase family 4 protein [Caenimonas sp. SL110]|uniref:glycosyltransferase family 4 protein n=1 Tax=Caenimonas sp. SL110 TaxID=1450524 RepID=UPI0006534F0F|nr:glycosyltransferase family 4 protein [Caenimonas sp. SL110]